MPERVFQIATVDELVAFWRALIPYLASGSTQEIRNNHTGFLKTSGPLSQVEVKNTIRDVRFEIYTRGKAGDGSADSIRCAALVPKNPLHERVMRVETTYAPPYFLTSPYGA